MKQNILLAIASSQAEANRLAKSVHANDLAKAIKNLQVANNNLVKKEAERAAKLRARNLKKLSALMKQMGISAEEIASLAEGERLNKNKRPQKAAAVRTSKPRKIKKVAPKYSIKAGKEVHKWTGRGRMPLVFKEFVQKGGSIDECLIK